MTNSLRASVKGLEAVDRARQRRGWTKTSTARWWQDAHTSRATLRRFWQGERIQQEIFIAICEVVGISQWEQVADPETLMVVDAGAETDAGCHVPLLDLDEAPDLEEFYGRSAELEQLLQWVVKDRCRVVAIAGLGGIGKTALALALVDRLLSSQETEAPLEAFDCILWRSLQTAPSLLSLLDSLLRVLAPSEAIQDIQAGTTHLLHHLREHRCLLVLDGLEAVLDPCHVCQQDSEDYSHFLQRLSQNSLKDRFAKPHQSCLVLTSRVQPTVVGWGKSVHLLKLQGLPQADAVELLQSKGCSGQASELAALNHLYGGNPLALKLTVPLIQTLFSSNVAAYLAQNTVVMGDRLRFLLQLQLASLSDLEWDIAYWLAIWQEPISLCRLQTHLLYPPTPAAILESLAKLEARSLLEKCFATQEPLLTLPPLVLQAVQDELVEATAAEVTQFIHSRDMSAFKILRSHCLLRPGTDDLAGDRLLTQLRDNLWSNLGSGSLRSLSQLVPTLNTHPPFAIGYAAYNLSALLRLLDWAI